MLKTYTRKQQENKIIEDVHKLCRLCLVQAEATVPIFGDSNNACAALPMRIMICVGHEITQEDCLPNSICVNCHQELERYYKFRKKCENSYLKLKAHYNATKYRQQLSEVQAENKLYEENKASELEYKMQEESEPQADEIERLVIVDVYNIDENVEYDKSMAVDSVAEPDVKIEEETMEIQVIEQTDDVNPDIATFLNAILVELGILEKSDKGLVVQDQGVTSFELETGDDDHVEFELVEQDDEEDIESSFSIIEVESKLQDADSKPNETVLKNGCVSKSVTDGKKSGAFCSLCGRAFASGSALRRHAAVHSGVRPHTCRDCGRGFAQKAVMERHRLVHQAVRPYKCVRCPKSFTQRGALAAHARAHAAPQARPLTLHACSHCDRMFLYASGLSRHMLSHSGHVFRCGTCSRAFSDNSSLLRHTRNAHARRP